MSVHILEKNVHNNLTSSKNRGCMACNSLLNTGEDQDVKLAIEFSLSGFPHLTLK